MQFDDGVSVPMHYLNPEGDIPLVPVTMNCTVPPIPTPGARLRGRDDRSARCSRAYPGAERVAVVATGGLSHEPGGPRYFWVDEEFDRWFLDLLKQGDHAALLRECTLERMEAAGSGGTAELLAWILALAFTTRPRRGARLHARGRLAVGNRHGGLAGRQKLTPSKRPPVDDRSDT